MQLSSDIFRHEPAQVHLIPAGEPQSSPMLLQSRFVRKGGLIAEVNSPFSLSPLLSVGKEVEVKVQLPHQDEVVMLKGTIRKVVLNAMDPKGDKFSLVGIRFQDVDLASARRLEAHDITVQSSLGKDRVARIPVRFPVTIEGRIDVMTQLLAMDLSMTGMFVGGKVKFSNGKDLNLHFRLPFQKKEVFLAGRVVWSGNKKLFGALKPSEGFGFQFQRIPPETHTALAYYYARNTITV